MWIIFGIVIEASMYSNLPQFETHLQHRVQKRKEEHGGKLRVPIIDKTRRAYILESN